MRKIEKKLARIGKKIAKIAEKIAKIAKNQKEIAGKPAKKIANVYPYTSVIIDGTLPKLSLQIGLMMPYKHTKFQVKSRQRAGLVSKRNTNHGENRKKNRKKIAKKSQKKIAKKIARKQ